MKKTHLMLHIGLRKTGTTTFQRSIFPSLIPGMYLGKAGEHKRSYSNLMSRIIKSRGRSRHEHIERLLSRIGELADAYRQNGGDLPSDTFVISSEGMSTRPTTGSLMKSVDASDFRPCVPAEYPVFPALESLRAAWKQRFGGEVKLLLTIRSQRELLASEYSQVSAYLTNPSQGDFERRATALLESRDQHFNYYLWARAMEDSAGRSNILMIDMAVINEPATLERLATFIGAEAPVNSAMLEENQRQNVSRTTQDTWKLRDFRISKWVKKIAPRGYRKSVPHRAVLRVARACDPLFAWVFRTVHNVEQPRALYVNEQIRDTIDRLVCDANRQLREEYSDILVE